MINNFRIYYNMDIYINIEYESVKRNDEVCLEKYMS